MPLARIESADTRSTLVELEKTMGYLAFQERMGQVNDLLNAKSILNWDALTHMPPGGAETRS